MVNSESLELAKKYLGQTVIVEIDRPLGTKHPKFDMVYEVNYGFVPDTKAPDGEELDAYVLGVDEPVTDFAGRCIAIIHRLDNDDDKLVVVPDGTEISNDDIRQQVNFQEKWFKSEIIRK
jgi:inorganic pyrophosphatase